MAICVATEVFASLVTSFVKWQYFFRCSITAALCWVVIEAMFEKNNNYENNTRIIANDKRIIGNILGRGRNNQ